MTTFEKSSPRERRKRLYIAGAVVFLAIYGALALAWGVSHGRGWETTWLHWSTVGAAAICLALSFAWVTALDEVELKAHTEAWFWGGLGGMALFAILLVALLPGEFNRLLMLDQLAARTVFFLGAFSVMLLMILGYSIWWIAFWLRKR